MFFCMSQRCFACVCCVVVWRLPRVRLGMWESRSQPWRLPWLMAAWPSALRKMSADICCVLSVHSTSSLCSVDQVT